MTDAGAPPNPDSAGQANAPYRVLARKYRPSSFDDLIGQEAVVRTVSNAFETGRIPQAWILTGVRGVGKTTTARILARALNYEMPDGSVKGPTIHMRRTPKASTPPASSTRSTISTACCSSTTCRSSSATA